MLAINEEFYSIQGEGLHTGLPMYFIRLQGCGVGCYFCDTKYTWRNTSPNIPEEDIIIRAKKYNAEWVCITGGEPMEQDISELLAQAIKAGLKTHIETSGSVWQEVPAKTWICLSPKDLFAKKGHETDARYKKRANEIKCVVTKEQDIDYYLLNYYKPGEYGPLIFQPVDNNPGITDLVLQRISDVPEARCMIQCHKVMELR